jgi:hypothetical protein
MITVEGHRWWFGDPRLGAIRIYVDGRRAGVIPPGTRLTIAIEPGTHTVRARQWWYRSQPLTVEVTAEVDLHLKADVVPTGNLLRRVMALVIAPSRGLTLTVSAPT